MHNTITRIQNHNYYLWGLLITAMFIILYELGKLPTPIIAQDKTENNYIQLSNGNELRSISIGSWVVVIRKNPQYKDQTVALQPIVGVLCGKVSDNLCIENPKTNNNVLIPFSEIEIFYHGEAKRITHYTLKGASYGFKLALAYGTFWGGMFAMDGYGIDESFIIGLMGAGCGSAVFIPSGALLGYMKGLSKEFYSHIFEI